MTTITYRDGSGSLPQSIGHSAFRFASKPLLAFRDQWRRRQTEKMLEGLPSDIRKDIGWPTSASGPSAR